MFRVEGLGFFLDLGMFGVEGICSFVLNTWLCRRPFAFCAAVNASPRDTQ